jgi:predicted DNA binding protein
VSIFNLHLLHNIKPVIAKLYSTDIPFFIMGKSISTLNLKPSIDIDTSARFDIATVRRKILNNAVLVHKPQVTKYDILNRKKFATFILSELGL